MTNYLSLIKFAKVLSTKILNVPQLAKISSVKHAILGSLIRENFIPQEFLSVNQNH